MCPVGLGALGTTVTLAIAPVAGALCRQHSARTVAVLGGLGAALGCLFASFATRFHQLALSYGLLAAAGAGLAREACDAIVGQYFKRRREAVELLLGVGRGASIALMPVLVAHCVTTLGWRLGLQLVTGLVLAAFFLGIWYRPASLYHPQRRAIVHLKALQRRRARDHRSGKQTKDSRKWDLQVLRSRTVQVLLFGSALTAFGIGAPFLLLVHLGLEDGLSDSTVLIVQVFLGAAHGAGALAFGAVVVSRSVQCMIARQYLCMAGSLLASLCLALLPTLDRAPGYLLFAAAFGFAHGGYVYALRMFVFEKVRARNFAKAWSFVQGVQALPHLFGPSIVVVLNEQFEGRAGFYFAAGAALLGTAALLLIDVHRWRGQRRPGPQDSPPSPPRQRGPVDLAAVLGDELLDITSCNKEEKFLMLSEFENNLHKARDQCPNCLRYLPPLDTPKMKAKPPMVEVIEEVTSSI